MRGEKGKRGRGEEEKKVLDYELWIMDTGSGVPSGYLE